MRVFMLSRHDDGTESEHFEVLSYNRTTHVMHCRWPHGAEFDWDYNPKCEWTKRFMRLVTRKDE
jgi:hypothetical protein